MLHCDLPRSQQPSQLPPSSSAAPDVRRYWARMCSLWAAHRETVAWAAKCYFGLRLLMKVRLALRHVWERLICNPGPLSG